MINFVQIDTEVKKIDVVKNKYQINKLKIKGLGGTKLSPGIRYIIEDKKLKKLNLLILTDGVTDILDFKNFNKKCLILSIGKKCEIKNINPKKIKQIIIKN